MSFNVMNIKNLVLGIAIIILTIFVVIYGISTFYTAPEYEDFCEDLGVGKVIETEEECTELGGRWNDDVDHCDKSYECREDYDDAREVYFRNLFLITLPLGLVIIVVGALVFGLEAVGAGLMGGGVGTILYGVGGYWRYSADVMKFVLSLIGLIAVIGLAYWFNRKFGKKKK